MPPYHFSLCHSFSFMPMPPDAPPLFLFIRRLPRRLRCCASCHATHATRKHDVLRMSDISRLPILRHCCCYTPHAMPPCFAAAAARCVISFSLLLDACRRHCLPLSPAALPLVVAPVFAASAAIACFFVFMLAYCDVIAERAILFTPFTPRYAITRYAICLMPMPTLDDYLRMRRAMPRRLMPMIFATSPLLSAPRAARAKTRRKTRRRTDAAANVC